MTEATGCEAQTIHRLLEVSGNPDDETVGGFQRNAENPLEADVIIIDEMSMVDLPLMYALLNAIVPGTRVILVGDVNQLPSVGPGSVLKDIISSGCFPVVKLTKIFRQAGERDIIVNAHKINRGEPVVLDNKSMDFFFLKRDDTNMIISNIITLIQKKLPKFVSASEADIQVLTPMRKGLLGVERINKTMPQAAVSIHQNSYQDAQIHGAQVFYYSHSEEGKRMAEVMQKALLKADEENTRQAKANDTYYLLKRTEVPTIIVECGFLSNPEEAAKLVSPKYQEKLAEAIAEGILACMEN